ncbi:uncharacterized protein LOC131028648 [Cryptomeria japonica]|uniref:uncharacterized protein LOC131028648 n=1 Tax=Cryptomeria japonica TaxID=3369 RepID=UPI0025AD3FAB|nr:uncharacterized protein LOC131028648 [Cryptomeria japonica]
MCVFVGSLLPRMAALSTGTKWSNIVALLISISPHISIEVYLIHNPQNVRHLETERVWLFVGSGGLLLLSITGLMVLLGCVVIAGKCISENISRTILHSLANNKLENEDNEKIFEYKILQTWWVTRVCQPEYVIEVSTFGTQREALRHVVLHFYCTVLFSTFSYKILYLGPQFMISWA